MGLDLLGREDPPTAIFAASDLTALGVLEAAREEPLAAQEKLSFAGHDDTPQRIELATTAAPPR